MILHCDFCGTSWDTDDPNQDRAVRTQRRAGAAGADAVCGGTPLDDTALAVHRKAALAALEESQGDAHDGTDESWKQTSDAMLGVYETPSTPQMSASFEHELTALLNRHGLDVYCATTDYILAAYITGVLEGLRKISLDRRARWADRNSAN